ncbi:MAG: protein kinase [Myxococcota bacterium]
MIGRSIIGQFVVRSKLGMGGMGAVYLADQPSVGRTAVIKVIHPWLSKDHEIADRFEAEARAIARLQNPHIVSIYNYGKLPDGTLFLAMEHIQGSTLAETLQTKGRIDASRAVTIATQCCEALGQAHRRGVVHRDVKPSNIMLQARHQGPGFVKMLDFGVATLDELDTAKGHGPTGTPCYMSPEQLGGGAVDGRSDIYSLAIVIYEMVVGQPPFLAPTPEDYARQHREVPPPAPSALAPEIQIPAPLEACIMRALAKEPHARPQTAEQFADALWGTVMGSTANHAADPVLFAHAIAKAPRRRRPARRRLVLAAGGVLTVAAAGITAGTLMLTDDDAPSPPPVASASTEPEPAAEANTPTAADPLLTALLSRSVAELEAELERAAILTGRDAAALGKAMTDYHGRARRVPAGHDPPAHRRRVLAELIVGWARAPQRAESKASIAELEAVFLRMESPLDVKERRDMLHELKLRDGIRPDEISTRLLEWIAQRGLDYQTGEPGAELVVEDDPSTQ